MVAIRPEERQCAYGLRPTGGNRPLKLLHVVEVWIVGDGATGMCGVSRLIATALVRSAYRWPEPVQSPPEGNRHGPTASKRT